MAREYDADLRRCVLLGQVKRLLRDRHRGAFELPDDDAGREYLELLCRLSADKNMRNTIESRAPWINGEADALVEQVQRMPLRLRLPTPKQLGEMLRLTNEERDRHRAWQIQACDISAEQRAEHRKAKERERQRRRRGRTRAEYLAASVNSREPWVEMGISRRTYFRRKGRGK